MGLRYEGKLIDVETGDYNSLVFESSKFDYRLQREVPISETVGISKEDLPNLPAFKKFIGEMISVPVNAIKTKKGGIFLLSNGEVQAV